MSDKPKLLIIEDDDLILEIFGKVLARHFDVHTAKTVEEYYSYLSENSYSAFLVDLSLRGEKDGIYLIKELRQTEKYANTPIVVVTANALKRDEETAINAGATTFIRKPVENERLTAEFTKFL